MDTAGFNKIPPAVKAGIDVDHIHSHNIGFITITGGHFCNEDNTYSWWTPEAVHAEPFFNN